MGMIGRIIGMVTLGQSISESPMFHRLLTGVAVVVTLTIVIGMMVGSIVLGVIYAFYLLLLQHGLDQTAAVATSTGLMLLVIVLLALLIVNYIRDLFDVPKMLKHHDSPLIAGAMEVADAFVDGLLTHPSSRSDSIRDPANENAQVA